MKTEYEYIRFIERPVSAEAKTKKWDCLNIRHGSQLGLVRWDGGWRQYIFAPATLSVPIFSADCLADIQDFIEQTMRERKAKP